MHIVIDYCNLFVSTSPFALSVPNHLLLLHSYYLFQIDISFEDIFFHVLLFFIFSQLCFFSYYFALRDTMLFYAMLSYHPSILYSPFPQHHPSLYQTISRLINHILLCDRYSHPRCTYVHYFIFTILI